MQKEDLNFRDLFLIAWSNDNNVYGVDFYLFSTLIDAENDTNPWRFWKF